ncbi:hypothetical protein TBLA_0E02940 [Henningerozyma blattae CBS 6284]|uniref:Uncharacterized protein n=1 Tax=Henningerozyma blattae (strain ATCC 34711 / CBS 6284 / DSM 70876 / NBRC 10599 / NRRL Y-10934 / UCD 77-7) TaxID=1071380 RepID=I2H4P6_HENB6|nr:hypothetical protein TBLA_0E02940 [Tetrapisispora blattae CBS 6284]CCH61348.1 hypothetical protein TBLA_0E02940 [Tetrapisispora blattae CBS 6284]
MTFSNFENTIHNDGSENGNNRRLLISNSSSSTARTTSSSSSSTASNASTTTAGSNVYYYMNYTPSTFSFNYSTPYPTPSPEESQFEELADYSGTTTVNSSQSETSTDDLSDVSTIIDTDHNINNESDNTSSSSSSHRADIETLSDLDFDKTVEEDEEDEKILDEVENEQYQKNTNKDNDDDEGGHYNNNNTNNNSNNTPVASNSTSIFDNTNRSNTINYRSKHFCCDTHKRSRSKVPKTYSFRNYCVIAGTLSPPPYDLYLFDTPPTKSTNFNERVENFFERGRDLHTHIHDELARGPTKKKAKTRVFFKVIKGDKIKSTIVTTNGSKLKTRVVYLNK